MRIVFLFLGTLFIVSCSRERVNFKLEVNTAHENIQWLYLARSTIRGTELVDSVLPDRKGHAVLKGYTSQPDYFILYQQPKQYINLIINPGDHFTVKTYPDAFDVNYLVEGSKDSRLIQKLVHHQARTLGKITELSYRYENSMGSANFQMIRDSINHIYDSVFASHRDFSIRMIKENPQSLICLMVLYQQLGRKSTVFDSRKDFIWYVRVDSALFPLYPDAEAVIDLNRRVREIEKRLRLEPGAPAPPINLPNRQGRAVSLSSLKGKYIVLIFWASWSTPSVNELLRFQTLYPKLGTKIEYYQVSLDRTRESWLSALDKLDLKGIQVCDTQYWDAPVVDQYQINQLPLIGLIDENGKMMKRNITIDELKRFIAEAYR
jgi:peroxiredoxin